MKKPQWKDAPKWANWLAMNHDGYWYWYENKPKFFDGCHFEEWLLTGGEIELAKDDGMGIIDSLEKRPSK